MAMRFTALDTRVLETRNSTPPYMSGGRTDDFAVPDPDLEIDRRFLQEKIFRPFGLQFGLKIRGGAPTPRAPPLDPPLFCQK